jgi:diguanylate cyclase (GGDEF)-like protein/PAS domain S-box-containing protein
MPGVEAVAVIAFALLALLALLALPRPWRRTGPPARPQASGDAESLLRRTERYSATGGASWDVRAGRLEWSPNLYRIHGVEPARFQPTADALLALIHSDDRERVAHAVARGLARPGEQFRMSYRIVRPDGSVRDLEWRGRVDQDAGGFPCSLEGAITDVTDRRRAERWLFASESRYRMIVENANDGIWVLGPDGTTDFVNRRLAQMLGRPAEQMLGRRPSDFADAAAAAALDGPRAAGAESGEYLELAFTHADGGSIWVAVSRSCFSAPVGELQVLVLTDLTQRREMETRLRHAAERDRLTGLWSRSHFEELLAAAIGDRQREEPLAVVFIAMDHFKYVNDALGHRVGDGLLRRVAQLFAASLRDGDELARMGGDEFAVLLPGSDQQAAIAMAERLLDALRSERWRGMASLRASAGVAVCSEREQLDAADLLVAADLALHQAKAEGRNRLAVFTGERGGFTWLDEIRAAIEEERLVLYSQPIVPLGDGRASEELLIRMIGRDGELIGPGAFIPPAEQFGLIVELDRWVVAQALELARAGRAVEVNLSAQSLGDDPIREAVERAVAEGVSPELLTFEITETAAARNLDDARDFSTALARLGCGFAIDDFGTGFGSLIYLRHLPIDRIKIDIQFVRTMLTEPEDERVVSAIVSAARTMGHETVAEGVEDEATLQRLIELGVDYAQGFHLQAPGPIAGSGGAGRHADPDPASRPRD